MAGFIDWLQSQDILSNNTNISTVASEKAVDVIKRLSGKQLEINKRVIDNVIAFTGMAGGTGASTIACNVAYTADKKGLSVIVLDLNIMYPIQHRYLDIEQDIDDPDLVSYLNGRNSLGESIYQSDGIGVIVANNRNIMDSINSENDLCIENFTVAIDRLRQLYDLVIIDCPMLVDNSIVNTALYLCDRIYGIWDDGITSMANTERVRRNLAASGIDAYNKLKIVMNKRTNISYSKFGLEKLGLELVETLPFDTAVIESGLKSKIFCRSASSASDNANVFFERVQRLTDYILADGGYIE